MLVSGREAPDAHEQRRHGPQRHDAQHLGRLSQALASGGPETLHVGETTRRATRSFRNLSNYIRTSAACLATLSPGLCLLSPASKAPLAPLAPAPRHPYPRNSHQGRLRFPESKAHAQARFCSKHNLTEPQDRPPLRKYAQMRQRASSARRPSRWALAGARNPAPEHFWGAARRPGGRRPGPRPAAPGSRRGRRRRTSRIKPPGRAGGWTAHRALQNPRPGVAAKCGPGQGHRLRGIRHEGVRSGGGAQSGRLRESTRRTRGCICDPAAA